MCAEMVIKVFVSGTFHDLRDVRDHVQRILSEQKTLPVAMSGEDERSREVKHLIDDELNTSDLFICILGERYGSRVNDLPTVPSWTHYEFENFLRREQARGGHLAMMVLEPKRPSRALDDCRANALRVYEAQKLSPLERKKDQECQQFFKRVVKGGKIDPPDPEFIDLDNEFAPISLERATRTPGAQFGNNDEITIALLRFMLREGVVYRERIGWRPELKEAAPSMAVEVDIPRAVLARFGFQPSLPALCAVTVRLKGHQLDAGSISDALFRENVWDDEDPPQLDVGGVPDPTVDNILRVMAEREFGAEIVAGRDAQIVEIAKRVAATPFRRTYLLKNIANRGIAITFVEKVWPALQKEIVRRAGSGAGLFLILSCNMAPTMLEQSCQHPHAKKLDAAKPILLTEDALFPDGPASESSKAKRAMSR